MLDINEIIIRHLDGSATKEEKEHLLSWLKQSEENRNEYFEICDLWLFNGTCSVDDQETEMALNRLRSRILTSAAPAGKTSIRKPLYFFLRIAAIFLLVFSVSYVILDQIKDDEGTPLVVNRLVTADGSKGEFVLPDGTAVWLNSNSTLEYPESFQGNERNVRLEGEAYFEVKRDETKPFCVDAGDMKIEVLGTRFMVQNYNRKSDVETILVDGKVKVIGSCLKDEVILSPGQRISHSKQTNETKLETVDTSDYMSWIYDKLSFDNDRLSDIITNMERWYGIDIKCPEVFARSTRMSFTIRGESVDEILKAMKLIVPIQYKWEKDTLYISSGEN